MHSFEEVVKSASPAWAQTLRPLRQASGSPGRASWPRPPADRRRGGASSRTRAVRSELQDAPALQRLRSPAEGGRPLLASPAALAAGFHLRPGHAPKRRPPGAPDQGGCRGKMASRFILEGYSEKGQR